MIKTVSDILEQYNPKKGTLETALLRLGITTGADTTTVQYENQVALNTIYENIVWAYRCINYIATNLARLEWKFYQVKGEEKNEVTDDPRLYIFKSPNKYQTPYDFKMESIVRLEMQGEMYWEMDIRNKMLVALYPDWRSEEVEPLVDGRRGITAYRRTLSNGSVSIYPADKVFYLHYINPTNQWRGLSPLRPVRNAAENDLNAVYFNKQFFKQGGRPSGVFTTDEKLTKVEADRLEATVKRKYQSVEQMHELLILWGGLKFNPLNSMNMTDMQFKDLRGMNREEIITAYGLSLEVLGLGEKTYTNVQYYRKLSWTETLIPKNEKIVGLINKSLLPAITGQDDIILEVDYDDVEALKEDRASMMTDYQKAFQMAAVTPNEIREKVLGLDPIDEPEMDVTYLPAMASPIGLEEEEQPAVVSTGTETPIVSTGTETSAVEEVVEEEEEQKTIKNTSDLYVIKKQLSANDRRILWQNRQKVATKWQQILKIEVLSYFKEQHDYINSRLDNYLGKSVMKAGLYDTTYWEKRLKDKSKPLIAAAMGDTAQRILDLTDQTFDVNSPYVRAILGQRVNKLSHFVNETTDKKIKALIEKALQENLEAGIQAQKIAIKEILNEFFEGGYAEHRADLIAQTEAMGAVNGGIMAGIEQSEEFERKMWLTCRDDRVRETHIPMDGVVINYNDMFILPDGQQMEYPQDYNERCVLMATDLPVT